MKTNLSLLLYTLIASILLVGCKNKVLYPTYSLETINYIPDSLKAKHREWIKETVRAASQQMTGGDYEDVGQTIIQAKWTADAIFGASVVGLNKELNENYWNDLKLKPNELSLYEKKILDSLVNAR